MTPLETETRDGFTVSLYQDNDPTSPDDWDNLATIEQASDYRFGESVSYPPRGDDWATYARWLRYTGQAVAVLPIRLDDYGSGGLRLYECNPEDAIGVMYTTDARLTELCGDGAEYHTREWALQALRGELEVWKQYFEGDVYGYVVEDASGEHIDSCWGIYDYDYAWKSEALPALDYAIENEKETKLAVSRSCAI